MDPSLNSDSYILTVDNSPELKKFFVISHKKYGKLVKKLVKIDNQKKFWFKGENKSSISTEKIGPIDLNQILGKVVLSVSKDALKLHR